MIDRREVLKTAWKHFRDYYGFGGRIRFKDVGMNCWKASMRRAWAICREAAQKAAMTVDQIKVRIDRLTVEIDRNQYRRWTPELSTETRDMRIELRQLTAQLAA